MADRELVVLAYDDEGHPIEGYADEQSLDAMFGQTRAAEDSEPATPLALPQSCWYSNAEWRDWPGIEGPVLICLNHGLPAPAEAYEDILTTTPCQEDLTYTPTRQSRIFHP